MTEQTISNAAILNTTLAEFRKNPFCPEYIIDALIKRGYNTLSDILDIDKHTAMEIPCLGKCKVQKLMDFRNMISSGRISEIEQFCQKHVSTATVPSANTESFSLSEKIIEVLSAMITAFESNGKSELAMLCREFFLENRTISDIYQDSSLPIRVTRERLRQQTVWLRDAIANNYLMRYRIEIDEHYLMELDSVRRSVSYCPKSTFREMLGEDAPDHCFTNLFNLDILGPESYTSSAIDQEYLVATKSSKNELLKSLQAIVFELHNEVRPMTMDELFTKVQSKRPSISRNDFEKIVANHTMICKEDNGLVYLEFRALYDYEKVARLIWEKQDISLEEMDAENEARTGKHRSISVGTHVVQQKFSWCKPMGKSGVWVYSDNNSQSEKSLRSFVKDYVHNHEVFSFCHAMGSVVKAGYRYPEKTVRAYFVSECCVSTISHDIMCAAEKAHIVSGIPWRKRMANCSKLEFAELAMRILKEKGPMTRNALVNAIRAIEPSRMGKKATIWKMVDRMSREGNALSLCADGMVQVLDDAEVQLANIVSTKKSIPEHYQAVVDEVIKKLSEAPKQMCQLSELKRACSSLIRPFAKDTLFYKIVDSYRPQNIEKVYIDGNAYLRQIA